MGPAYEVHSTSPSRGSLPLSLMHEVPRLHLLTSSFLNQKSSLLAFFLLKLFFLWVNCQRLPLYNKYSLCEGYGPLTLQCELVWGLARLMMTRRMVADSERFSRTGCSTLDCDRGEADSGEKLRELLSREGEIEESRTMRRWEGRTEKAMMDIMQLLAPEKRLSCSSEIKEGRKHGRLRERTQGGEKGTVRTRLVSQGLKSEALEPTQLDVFLVWDTSHLILDNLYISNDISNITSLKEMILNLKS